MVIGNSVVRDELRNNVWRVMEERGIARFPRPVFGRIPNFVGAENAAMRLVNDDLFKRARVVKVNPDSPQRPVREAVLRYGKVLIMPTPRISKGFLLLNPKRIPSSLYPVASTISGAFRYGEYVEPEEIPEVDLVVTGSTVVSIYGERLGKGEGYSELEYGILIEYGKLSPEVPIVTTVHDVQVINQHIPLEPWDFTVDYIYTPTKVLKSQGVRVRPKGILWDYLSEEKLREIPLLQKLKLMRK
jgi:5-formyltetrahydrofolate cyclo-ligase